MRTINSWINSVGNAIRFSFLSTCFVLATSLFPSPSPSPSPLHHVQTSLHHLSPSASINQSLLPTLSISLSPMLPTTTWILLFLLLLIFLLVTFWTCFRNVFLPPPLPYLTFSSQSVYRFCLPSSTFIYSLTPPPSLLSYLPSPTLSTLVAECTI